MSILSVYFAPGHNRPTDLDYIRQLQPPIVRILEPDVRQISDAYKAAPNAIIMPRFWWLDDGNRTQHEAMIQDPIGTATRHAAEWKRELERLEGEARQRNLPFPDRQHIIVSGVNEPDSYAHGDKVYKYTKRFLTDCTTYNIRAGGLVFSVGHPAKAGEVPFDWPYFAGLEPIIKAGSHVVICHEYTQPEGPFHGEDWGNLAGRHRHCPIDAPIVIGEYGVDSRIYNRTPSHVGWRGHMSAEQFADQLVTYHNNVDPRVIGICVYLTDFRDNAWASFDTEPAHGAILARLGQLKKPSPVGPPPDASDDGSTSPTGGDLLWPAPETTRITQYFVGNRGNYPNSSVGHMGIDIACALGTPVQSPADGVVAWCDVDPGYGNYIRVYHPEYGFCSFFAHLREVPSYKQGDIVKAGDVIAHTGNTGNSTGPHLHYEVRLSVSRYAYVTTDVNAKGQVDPLLFHRWMNRGFA